MDLWISAAGGEVYFSCSRGERNPEIQKSIQAQSERKEQKESSDGSDWN
jgi:hypothetical protein